MSNFHHTAEIHTIRVEDGRILRSRVAREDGEFVDSEIDLDRCVGNDNGMKGPKLVGLLEHFGSLMTNRAICVGRREYDVPRVFAHSLRGMFLIEC